MTAERVLGRIETPEDVALAVAFLASNDARFITGRALAVNGEVAYALSLLTEQVEGVGYLLKDSVTDGGSFTAALRRVQARGTVVDPSLVADPLGRPRVASPLTELTPRELEVLALMAEGRTDRGIGEALFLSTETVEAHVRSIFRKLDLPAAPSENRRVHGVITFVRA